SRGGDATGRTACVPAVALAPAPAASAVPCEITLSVRGAVLDSMCVNVESSTAPRTLNRFQQRNAVRIFGGVKPGVTKEDPHRVLETAATGAAGPGVGLDYAGESRQIRPDGAARTVTPGFAVILIYLARAAQVPD